MNPRLLVWANTHKFLQCAIVWIQENRRMDHPTSLWKVTFLSKGMMPLRGVRRTIDIRFLHTGKRMNATST